MGLSETIIAALIGAGATMATAIFQLARSRAPGEARPKKNRIRSLFATIALMIGCIVAGYAWSSLRAVSAADEMRSTLEAEFTKQFAALAVHQTGEGLPTEGTHADGGTAPAGHATPGITEPMVRLASCRPVAGPDGTDAATCTEHAAQTVVLCAALPATAQNVHLQVMARVQKPDSVWQKKEDGAATIGDLHVSEAQPEQSQTAAEHAACLNVANWSVTDALMVRLLADYTPSPPAPIAATAAPITASLQ